MPPEINNNQEIANALAEFEAKSIPEQQASQDPDALATSRISQVPVDSENPKMINWIMKLSGGAIKSRDQANYVLLGCAIIFFGISFYLFWGGGTPTVPRTNGGLNPYGFKP